MSAPRRLLVGQLPFFFAADRVEMSVPAPATDTDVGLLVQFLCHGNYADEEYPAFGPDEVIAMPDKEVNAELARGVELDLSEAGKTDWLGTEAEWEMPEWDPRYDDGKKMEMDNTSVVSGPDSDEGDDGEDGGEDGEQDADANEPSARAEGDDGTNTNAGDTDAQDAGNSDIDMASDDGPDDGDDPLATDYPPSMLTSFRMYVLAARIGLPRLQLLARRRLYMSAVRHVMHPDFVSLVDIIYSSFSHQSSLDTALTAVDMDILHAPLRNMVCRFAVWIFTTKDLDGKLENKFKAPLRGLMAKHPGLTTDVMNAMAEGVVDGNRRGWCPPWKSGDPIYVSRGPWDEYPEEDE